jgi:hypothetical protein
MKILLKLMAIIAIAAVGVTNAQAEIKFSPTQWPPLWNENVNFQSQPLTHYGFDIVDTFNSGSTDYSFIRILTPGPQPFCSSLSDAYCQDLAKRYGWWIIRLLPPCADVNEKTECIEGLTITKGNGEPIKLVNSAIYARNTFAAEPENGLKVGSGSSLWVDPKNPDSGNGYLVTVSGDSGAPFGSKSFPLTNFDASVIPYTTKTGNFDTLDVKIQNGRGMFYSKPNTLPIQDCLWLQKGKCGVAVEFEDNLKMKFVLHLPSTLSHWVIGRLANPSLAVESLGEVGSITYERLTVDAAPISVPMVGGTVKVEDASAEIKSEFSRNNCPECGHGIWTVNVESSNEGAFRFIEMFKPWLNDKSMVSIKNFSISSMGNSQANMAKCDRKGSISGLIATNASAYVGRPPQFDGSSLNYKVGAMHYTSDGSVFKGVYDLFMPEETAKCLYGFSAAPISASVSITTESGENSVATSVLSKRDGWIHLNSSGFTFSSPTIKVKLVGEKVSSQGAVQNPPQNLQKMTTIWCAKGHAKKKVTAAKPACPKGYKKIKDPFAP